MRTLFTLILATMFIATFLVIKDTNISMRHILTTVREIPAIITMWSLIIGIAMYSAFRKE